MHWFLRYTGCLVALSPSGFWHHLQRRGQPLKNTVVRIPSPSCTAKRLMSNTRDFHCDCRRGLSVTAEVSGVTVPPAVSPATVDADSFDFSVVLMSAFLLPLPQVPVTGSSLCHWFQQAQPAGIRRRDVCLRPFTVSETLPLHLTELHLTAHPATFEAIVYRQRSGCPATRLMLHPTLRLR